MSIALYTTMIALFRLRVTAVFVDPSAGRERLNRCVARVRPDAFVAVPRAHWLRLTSPAIRAIPIKAAIGGGVPGAAAIARRVSDAAASVEPCDPDTPAIITFTSGSTGEPKAAVRTHGFLIAQHRALVDSLELAPGEIDLCTLPIFLLANLASGVTSVIPDADLRAPGAIDPAPVDAQIRAMRPTRTVASPAFVARLVDHAVRHGAHLDTFRRIYTGGAPVFPEMLDAIAAVAPNASVVAVYGSTEAEPIAKIDRRDISADDRAAMTRGAGLLAGRPASSIQLRILPDRWGTPVGPWTVADLERDTLGPDEVGEIVVTGEHVLCRVSRWTRRRGNEDQGRRARLASHRRCGLSRCAGAALAARTLFREGERQRRRPVPVGRRVRGRRSARRRPDGVRDASPAATACRGGRGRRRGRASRTHGAPRLGEAGRRRHRPAHSRRPPPQRQGGIPGAAAAARSSALTGHLLMENRRRVLAVQRTPWRALYWRRSVPRAAVSAQRTPMIRSAFFQ